MTSSAKKTTPAKLMATQSPVESLSVARSNAPEMLSPSNAEAEQAVLGSLVIDPDAALVVEPILKESDFYFEKHRWIFAVC